MKLISKKKASRAAVAWGSYVEQLGHSRSVQSFCVILSQVLVPVPLSLAGSWCSGHGRVALIYAQLRRGNHEINY